MIAVSDLPAVNAALNATAAILIGAGVYFIKRKNIPAHKACMVAALAVSTLFLTSYLTYHYNVGNVRFTKQGWIRNVYFPLLESHTILDALILPMILRTAFLALRGRFRNHVSISNCSFTEWRYCYVHVLVGYLVLVTS